MIFPSVPSVQSDPIGYLMDIRHLFVEFRLLSPRVYFCLRHKSVKLTLFVVLTIWMTKCLNCVDNFEIIGEYAWTVLKLFKILGENALLLFSLLDATLCNL